MVNDDSYFESRVHWKLYQIEQKYLIHQKTFQYIILYGYSKKVINIGPKSGV